MVLGISFGIKIHRLEVLLSNTLVPFYRPIHSSFRSKTLIRKLVPQKFVQVHMCVMEKSSFALTGAFMLLAKMEYGLRQQVHWRINTCIIVALHTPTQKDLIESYLSLPSLRGLEWKKNKLRLEC